MSKLFSPFALRGLALANRIVISPMCQYSAVEGSAQDWHMIHLGSLALSGAAMLCIEATAVEAIGRITPGDLGLYNSDNEAALKPVVTAIRKHSPIAVAMQLAHAGRKASCKLPWEGGAQIPPDAPEGWRTVAPSPIAFNSDEAPPLALDEAGMTRIKQAFVAAAQRAQRLGLDALEIHSAHGYLLHEFLSPLSNTREDKYGGSLENRMRFPLEVFEAVRAAFPANKPVGVRVSASDWVDGGWDIEQTKVYAGELKARGADWIDCSSGGNSPAQKIPLSQGYQVPFSDAVRAATGLPTIAVGLITDPGYAEGLIESGKADLVALARGMLFDPRWPWHAAAKLGAQAVAPPQYLRAAPREAKDVLVQAK